MDKVIRLYKKIGETPLEAMERYRAIHPEYNGIKMTYAGRLDPMAEGLLLVLAGDAVYEKEKYTSLSKEYKFQILFGVMTDTGDILGIVKKTDCVAVSTDNLLSALRERVGEYSQTYPKYSSKTVFGIPLWRHSREGNNAIVPPKTTIKIHKMSLCSREEMGGNDILSSVIERVSLVRGDFRQDEIKKSWIEAINPKDRFTIAECLANVSSGTYIRALAEDVASRLGLPGLAFGIKRTKIGDFDIL